MKTPKREQYYRTQKAAVYADSEGVFPNHAAYEHARWKRKNRVARLKDKIARLTAENKWLSEERRKYIEYYFNTLHDLLQTQKVFIQKKQKRKEAQQ